MIRVFRIGFILSAAIFLANPCYAGLDKAFKNLVRKEESRLLEHYGLEEKPKPAVEVAVKKQPGKQQKKAHMASATKAPAQAVVEQPAQPTETVASADDTSAAAQPEQKGKRKRKKNKQEVA